MHTNFAEQLLAIAPASPAAANNIWSERASLLALLIGPRALRASVNRSVRVVSSTCLGWKPVLSHPESSSLSRAAVRSSNEAVRHLGSPDRAISVTWVRTCLWLKGSDPCLLLVCTRWRAIARVARPSFLGSGERGGGGSCGQSLSWPWAAPSAKPKGSPPTSRSSTALSLRTNWVPLLVSGGRTARSADECRRAGGSWSWPAPA
mmetsp:Transcript_99872/g.321942  ORF Transcript_99872/g.321942 Transcript_99872/m.321942 type:complete len:205 (+) Transcript_99872:191-805(+)